MKLNGGASDTALVLPLTHRGMALQSRYRCLDGTLTSADVARAAGVSRKEAKRAIDAYCKAHEDEGLSEDDGATLTLDSSEVPAPATQTRAAMARIVADKIGIGRFGLKKRIAERAAARPPAKKKERRVSATSHPWKVGKHGRSVKGARGGGVAATVTCSKCPATLTINFRQLADSDEMDRKFADKGWRLDPTKCPEHNHHNHQRKDTAKMATTAPPAPFKTSPAAIAAQAKMFGLLQMHFDADTGVYASGYSDGKIAEECGLAVELVAGVRTQAFGELKVPAEVQKLTDDIGALESLLDETIAPIRSELAALRRRVTECCKRFGG